MIVETQSGKDLTSFFCLDLDTFNRSKREQLKILNNWSSTGQTVYIKDSSTMGESESFTGLYRIQHIQTLAWKCMSLTYSRNSTIKLLKEENALTALRSFKVKQIQESKLESGYFDHENLTIGFTCRGNKNIFYTHRIGLERIKEERQSL
jgi:hypothetical protein